MNCAVCSAQFTDGVQCSVCKKKLDFGCAGIAETTYRRMGADRKASWRCGTCRAGSPAPTSLAAEAPSPSLVMVMEKLNSMEKKLESIPKLTNDINELKSQINKLEGSCHETISKIEEFASKFKDVELRVTSLEGSLCDMVEIKSQLFTFQCNELAREQHLRLNNVEIKGVPQKKNENLFDIIGKIGSCINYKVDKPQINYVSRIPSFGGRDKSIVVSFLNRYVKEDFVASARLLKSLSCPDIGFADNHGKIYVNDHLSPAYKKLLTKVKQVANEKSYQFTWVKFSKIHVRKNDQSPVIIVKSELDLNKLV